MYHICKVLYSPVTGLPLTLGTCLHNLARFRGVLNEGNWQTTAVAILQRSLVADSERLQLLVNCITAFLYNRYTIRRMMTDFDIQTFLNLTELSDLVKSGDKPTLDLLTLLVKHHVTHVPYQNLGLMLTRSTEDLSPQAVMKRMLIGKKGGMCFDGTELMLHVLKSFNFDARRVSAFVTISGRQITDNSVLNHNFLVVHIEGKKYLVDIIFSVNSIRVPLEFSFEETEEKIAFPTEKYRLECHEDHYELFLWIKGTFAPMYRFKRPLTYTDDQTNLLDYRRFVYSPDRIVIRDELLKVAILTNTGRVGYTCKFLSKERKGSPPYKKMEAKDVGDVLQSQEVSYEEFRDSIKNIVNVIWDDDWFEK